MNGRDWQIGRILGIPIKVHVSWFLVFGFVTWSLATGYLPEALPGLSVGRYWVMGSVASLLLFGSVLLHELGHSYVALRYRVPIGQITLFVFGGIAQMHREPPGPRAEFLIAIAGPLVSFTLGGLLLGLASVADAQGLQGLIVLGFLLGSVNLQLGLFNLIPGFPLDGGRVLRAGLWAWSGDFYRATRQASLAGQGFGLGLGLLGAVLLVGAISGTIPGPVAANGGWIALIGLFLFGAARSSRRQAALRASLTRMVVGDLMVRNVVTIPSELTVEDAVSRYFLQHGFDGFPVQEDGRLVGMLAVSDVQTLPRSLWAWRRVRDIMQPWSASVEVSPDTPAFTALEQMLREGESRLGVVQDGRLVGLVTRSSIGRFLQLHGLRR
ncbi:MAG: site-2 protease family protein [Nitrospirae bacterium]|nr:site-2 protease family protein [Nitrospirota bacterium]